MAYSSESVLRRTFDYLLENGVADTWRRASSAVGQKLFHTCVHRRVEPSLRYLWPTAQRMETSAFSLAREVLASDVSESRWSEVVSEFESLEHELARRYETTKLVFPQHYGVERDSAFLLYAVARFLRPAVAVETGVANGVSSYFLLNALRNNNAGTLVSFDVNPNAGPLLCAEERKQWRFEVLKRPFKQHFVRVLDEAGAIDVFVHDSDHWYGWTYFEMSQAFPRMRRGGILLCDDAEYSLAFHDFCERHGIAPIYLVEPRKIFGMGWVGNEQNKTPTHALSEAPDEALSV